VAYYLVFDGVNDYVSVASNVYPNNTTTWEIEAEVGGVTGTNSIYLVGRTDSFSDYVRVATQTSTDSTCRIRYGSTTLEWSVRLPDTSSGPITVKFTRDGNTHELFFDGVSQGTQSSALTSTAAIRAIGQASNVNYSGFSLYSFVVRDSPGGTIINSYDPSATGGTGSVLEDTVGGNDGTLTNFPGDDSEWVFYSTGIEQAVGLVTETNTALATTAAKAKAIGLSSDTNTALALSTAIDQAVGLVSETSATFSLSATKAAAVGINTESNTSLALASSKALAVGLSSESNTGLATSADKSKAVGLSSETNTAFAVTPITAGGAVVGLVTETNTALSTTASKVKAVGLVSETNAPLAVTAAKSATVGQVSTLDSAAQLAILKSLIVGASQQTDTALPLSIAQTIAVGLATETNDALSLATLGLASWVYTVPPEQRIITVSAEQRSYTVPAEARSIEVAT
jgi:hypothetical protein